MYQWQLFTVSCHRHATVSCPSFSISNWSYLLYYWPCSSQSLSLSIASTSWMRLPMTDLGYTPDPDPDSVPVFLPLIVYQAQALTRLSLFHWSPQSQSMLLIRPQSPSLPQSCPWFRHMLTWGSCTVIPLHAYSFSNCRVAYLLAHAQC